MRKGNPLVILPVLTSIVILLAAVAWPAWRTHIVRTHVEDAIGAVDAAKVIVMEAAVIHGGLDRIRGAEFPTVPPGELASHYAARVDITDGGRITLTTQDAGSDAMPVLQFVPHSAAGAGIRWDCLVLSGDASLAPSDCASALYEVPNTQLPAPSATVR